MLSTAPAFRALLATAVSAVSLSAFALDPAAPHFRIGTIGSGRIGSAVAEQWAKAGHEVMFSSLDLAHDRELAQKVGHGARAGTPAEAAAFGDIVFIAVPYTALPQIGRDHAAAMKGKVVVDASNPIPSRDGDMAVAAKEKGTGVASPEFLPGVRLVRAFNETGAGAIRSEAHRAGEPIGIPVAADDPEALQVGIRLVKDAGFEPVVVGGLASAKKFDYGSPVFGKPMTAQELRKALDVK